MSTKVTGHAGSSSAGGANPPDTGGAGRAGETRRRGWARDLLIHENTSAVLMAGGCVL